MHKHVADLWIADLRSGSSRQGYGALNENDEEFCCLGRLCIVAGKVFEGSGSIKYITENDHDYNAYPPPSVWQDFADMKTMHGSFYDKNGKSFKLSGLNDSYEYDFNQIADVIEKYWEQL